MISLQQVLVLNFFGYSWAQAMGVSHPGSEKWRQWEIPPVRQNHQDVLVNPVLHQIRPLRQQETVYKLWSPELATELLWVKSHLSDAVTVGTWPKKKKNCVYVDLITFFVQNDI